MNEKKGVGGREVPGATFVNSGASSPGHRKKKKKGGKRHQKSASIAQQSEATLVNEAGETEHEHVEIIVSDTDHLPAGLPSPSLVVQEATKHNEIDSHIARTNWNEEHSPWTPDDDSTFKAESALHWKQPDQAKDIKVEEKCTSAEWSDSVVGDIVTRTSADGTQQAKDHTETKKQVVSDWFHSQTTQHFRNLTELLQQRAIEHLTKLKYTDSNDAEWMKSCRVMVWKAVVRANFFWLNPHTKLPTGKPKPVQRPAGVFENHFEAFVECASERLDRVGRDLPTPEYVQKVEDEVRRFLTTVEYAGKLRELQHLAFLLLFEEEQRKAALTLEDMQQRIRRALSRTGLSTDEFEFMKMGKTPSRPEHSVHTVSVADAIWRDALKEFGV